MTRYKKEDVAQAEERIRKLVRPTPYTQNEKTGRRSYNGERQKIYLCIKHVSRSGMQREISIYVHDGDSMQMLSWSTAVVLGWSMGKHDGVKVDGCGMNMGFHLVDCMVNRVFGRDVSANDFILEWL